MPEQWESQPRHCSHQRELKEPCDAFLSLLSPFSFFHWCEKARAGRLGNRVSTARQRREGERSKGCKAAAAAMQTETEGGERALSRAPEFLGQWVWNWCTGKDR